MVIPPPTVEQTQCIAQGSNTNSEDVMERCSDIPNMATVRTIHVLLAIRNGLLHSRVCMHVVKANTQSNFEIQKNYTDTFGCPLFRQ